MTQTILDQAGRLYSFCGRLLIRWREERGSRHFRTRRITFSLLCALYLQLHPRMLQHLVQTHTVFRPLNQNLGHKIFCRLPNIYPSELLQHIVHFLVAAAKYLIAELEGRLSKEKRRRHDSNTPHITLLSVGLVAKHLWSAVAPRLLHLLTDSSFDPLTFNGRLETEKLNRVVPIHALAYY